MSLETIGEFIERTVDDKIFDDSFRTLLYDLGEINFRFLKDDIWNEYINKNKPFTEVQMRDIKNFYTSFIDDYCHYYNEDLVSILVPKESYILTKDTPTKDILKWLNNRDNKK